MLKNRVPADCVIAAHQAARPAGRVCRSAADSQVCTAPPAVNSSEPTKKVTASTVEPTRSTYPGNGPMRKHAEPSPNAQAMRRSGDARPDVGCSATSTRYLRDDVLDVMRSG